MKIIKDNLSFARVYFSFLKEHSGSQGFSSANWEIKSANQELKKWQLIELDLKEIYEDILLVHHHHSMDGLELIPPLGNRVMNALDNFKKMAPEYSIHNKDCYNQILSKSNMEFNAVFLSRKPVTTIPEHQKLIAKSGDLIHLDGLHRLIGWSYAGKFSEMYKSNKQKVTAFVAG
jgi:hypothetical protein